MAAHPDQLGGDAAPAPATGVRIALAGGGTGGHITPGVALLESLASTDALGSVTWMAGDRRIDRRILGRLDERFAPIPVRVLSLGIEGGRDGAPSRPAQLVRAPRAVLRAVAALREARAELLVCLGGYPCLPSSAAARVLGVPVVVLEVNALVGGATRLIGGYARRVCHAFESSLPGGAESETHRWVGPVVRQRGERELAALRERGLDQFASYGLSADGPRLLVLGGSQGARALNRFAAEFADVLRAVGIQVLHQVGPGRMDEAASAGDGYAAVEFLDPVEPAMAAADLVLSRAGAATLAELASLRRPSVLVPYPHAAGDHQALNARAFGEGALVVEEPRLDADLAEGLVRLIGADGRARREAMSGALGARMGGDGAAELARLCLEVLDRDPAAGPARRPAEPSGGPRYDPSEIPAGIPRRVHLLGIGGAGVSGLARLLVARGARPSGHDLRGGEQLADLSALGIPIDVGSEGDVLPADTELVVRSAAVPESAAQVRQARERGLPVLKYAAALGRIAPAGRTLAVAGTHGKTSTAWLALHSLRGAAEALDRAYAPGALIGGECRQLGTNALMPGPDGTFVVEACEYDRSFLELSPRTAIVTNLEADHLDCFGDLDGVIEAFAAFAARVDPDGLLILGPDVPDAVASACPARVVRFGRELRVAERGVSRGRYRFAVQGPGWVVREVDLGVPGRFQMVNASLALAAAIEHLGLQGELDERQLERAGGGLERYTGARRRFDPWLELDEVDVVHDYAHHPTEVRATLAAAGEVFPDRPLHVLFQPHQFERTARFLDEFGAAFDGATRVVVADVYGARAPEGDAPAADAAALVERIRSNGVEVVEGGNLISSVERLVAALDVPAAVLVLGAGDVESIRDDLVRRVSLRCRSPR